MAKAVLTPLMESPVPDSKARSAPGIDELHLLLGEMDDELAAYRWREAIWISLLVHALVFLCWIFVPKWMPRSAIIVAVPQHQKQNTTFIALPPSPRPVKPPKTDITSDQNRIAQSRTPVPSKEALKKILNAQAPGAPGRPVPPAAPPQRAVPEQAAPAAQQGQPGVDTRQQQTDQVAKLETPPQPKPSAGPNPFQRAMAPGSAVRQAIEGTSSTRGTTHMSFGGDYGTLHHQASEVHGDVDILSDTMGVDFGPYLQRVIWEVKNHWYNLIPEVARPPIMKRGKLDIVFAIKKDGSVAGMTLERSSGDVALDRAAWGGITDSKPFPPLPDAFQGPFLQLRFRFFYNPETNELE